MKFSLGRTVLACTGLLVLVSLSCSQSGSPQNPFRPLEFNVDSTLLGTAIHAGGVGVRPPKNWSAADSQLVTLARNSLAADTTKFRFELVRLHVDTSSGAMILLKQYQSSAGTPFMTWAREFVSLFRSSRTGIEIREEWMMVSDLPVVQLQMADSVRVYFSLVCAVDPPVGIDYVVPKPAWANEVRAVESSIGTISR